MGRDKLGKNKHGIINILRNIYTTKKLPFDRSSRINLSNRNTITAAWEMVV